MAKDEGRLPPFTPLLVSTMDSKAWRAMSHGAKVLYISLRRRVPNGRNRAFLSFRHAMAEIGSGQRNVGEWFRELQHYGFIVEATPGCLGIEGKGKAPHWRLTELGQTSKAGADGLFEPPTRDFLKWNGELFVKGREVRDPNFVRRQKQNPVSDGEYTPYPTVDTPPYPTVDTPKVKSVSDGGYIRGRANRIRRGLHN